MKPERKKVGGAFKILIGETYRPLGKLGVARRTMLEQTLKKYMSIRGIELIRLTIWIIGKLL